MYAPEVKVNFIISSVDTSTFVALWLGTRRISPDVGLGDVGTKMTLSSMNSFDPKPKMEMPFPMSTRTVFWNGLVLFSWQKYLAASTSEFLYMLENKPRNTFVIGLNKGIGDREVKCPMR